MKKKKNGTFDSYDLYDAEIEKRLFYLGNELLALDLKLISEPIFRKNANKFWDDFKSLFCYITNINNETNEKDLTFLGKNMQMLINLGILPIELILFGLDRSYFKNKNKSLNLKKFKEIYFKEYDKNKFKSKIFK